MNLKQILFVSSLGLSLGCDPSVQNSAMQAEAMPVSTGLATETYSIDRATKNYLEGEVIQEVKAFSNLRELPFYPYAFTLKDTQGKFWTFFSHRDEALGFDSRIDQGDKIKIHGNYYDSGTLQKPNCIEVLEKAPR